MNEQELKKQHEGLALEWWMVEYLKMMQHMDPAKVPDYEYMGTPLHFTGNGELNHMRIQYYISDTIQKIVWKEREENKMTPDDSITQRNDDDVRAGKVKCEHCGDPLQMYYKPWCPRCDKPEPTQTKVLNFLQCIYHIEAMEGMKEIIRGMGTDFKNTLWNGIIEYIRNDTYLDGEFLSIEDPSTIYDPDGTFLPALILFNKYFPVDEDTIFWISW